MSVFNDAMHRLDNLLKVFKEKEIDFGVTDEALNVLRMPKKVIQVSFPFKTKTETQIIQGYRVQYNDALGPTKGGIRFHPEVDMEEVEALAFWMSIKNALMGLPYGGGKGGISFDPKECNEDQLEQISREYIRQIHQFFGPTIDIPAPDVYTNPKIMGWMIDEFNKIKGEHLPGMITGKPLSIGGSEGRSYATSMGGYFVLREVLEGKKGSVAVQGFGNAGTHIARIMHEKGFKIIAVSDSKGAIYDKKGLDIPKLIEHKKLKPVSAYEGKIITNDELLELDVDVLAFAALANSITESNVDSIKAKYLLELANGPISPEAEEKLKSKVIIPDVLANAGGVTVSYFEWMQNISGDTWSEEKVLSKLEKKMVDVYSVVKKLSDKYNIDLRTAGYLHAISRIIEAEKDKGRIR